MQHMGDTGPGPLSLLFPSAPINNATTIPNNHTGTTYSFQISNGIPGANYQTNNSRMVASSTSTISCAPYEKMAYLEVKVWLVALLGTLVALTAIVTNSLLIAVLFRPGLRATGVLYLAVLAVLETWLSITYLVLFVTQILADQFSNYPLYHFWLTTLKPAFTLARMAQFSSTYLIVVATVERYCATGGGLCRLFRGCQCNCTQSRRVIAITVILMTAFAFKVITYWEISITPVPGCLGFEGWYLGPSSLARNPTYNFYFMYHWTHISQVFFPFSLLLCLNVAIIRRLRTSYLAQSSGLLGAGESLGLGNSLLKAMGASEKHMESAMANRKQIREATKLLILVVTSYLLSNSLSTLVTSMEHINRSFLFQHPKFYTITVDVSNLLYVLNAAIRLFIYYYCNASIRSEIQQFLTTSWVTSCFFYFGQLFPSKPQSSPVSESEIGTLNSTHHPRNPLAKYHSVGKFVGINRQSSSSSSTNTIPHRGRRKPRWACTSTLICSLRPLKPVEIRLFCCCPGSTRNCRQRNRQTATASEDANGYAGIDQSPSFVTMQPPSSATATKVTTRFEDGIAVDKKSFWKNPATISTLHKSSNKCDPLSSSKNGIIHSSGIDIGSRSVAYYNSTDHTTSVFITNSSPTNRDCAINGKLIKNGNQKDTGFCNVADRLHINYVQI